MKTGKDFTRVERTAEPPYQAIEVSVGPLSTSSRGVIGHTVEVMINGEGTHTRLAQAEAEARAVLAAIEDYREKNPEVLS